MSIKKELNDDLVLSKINLGGTTYNLKDTKARDDLAEETARAKAAEDSLESRKVEATLTADDGSKAKIFNEKDGGGAKYENKDGTASFAGVNSNTNGGIGAQLYDIDVASNKGAKLDVTKNGIFYTTGDASALPAADRDVAENELVVKSQLEGAAEALEEKLDAEIDRSKAADEAHDAAIATETSERKAADIVLQNNINAEEAARIAADDALEAKKVDKDITSTTGTAKIFNEADGGGAKFENNNGTASFAGVNSDTNGGIGAQLYDINVNENKGSKLDVTINGIYYTTGADSQKPATERDVEANEIATNADVAAEKARAEAAEALKLEKYKVTVNGNDGQYVGDANVPVYFDADVAADKITVNSYAITLNTTKEQVASKHSLEIPAATTVTAGLMSAKDAKDVKEDLPKAIADEKDRALAAEAALAQDISDEKDRAEGIEAGLDTRIQNLEARGRFLSSWNSGTGKPADYPSIEIGGNYPYKAGDYYIVGSVPESGIKYKPDGSAIVRTSATEYTVPSATETREVGVGDYYIYTASGWVWVQNSQKTINFSQIAGDARDNINLKGHLDGKLNPYTVTVGDYTGVANVPVYFDTTPATDKITVNAYSIKLTTDAEQEATKFSMDVPAASASAAGLMSVTDAKAVRTDLPAAISAEKDRAQAAEALKLEAYDITVKGNHVGTANVPVYFDTTPAADKITVNAYSIALTTDKTQTAQQYSMDVPGATSSTAGLMTAADKAKLDNMSGDVDAKIAAEKARAEAAETELKATKVDKDITTSAGTAKIFNEADGGGAKFESVDGTASFAGVNSDTNGGIGAQLYDIDVAANKGSKIDVTKNGVYYTKGDESAKSADKRDVAANEILTQGRKIAGIDLIDDITDAELKSALKLRNLAYSDTATGTIDSQTISNAKADYTPSGSVNVGDTANGEVVTGITPATDKFLQQGLKYQVDAANECLSFFVTTASTDASLFADGMISATPVKANVSFTGAAAEATLRDITVTAKTVTVYPDAPTKFKR